ncbi:MAG: branched-chain amino acid ABC transporter permease [Eubacteriales bacterium]|nr:branched-chain amino acid ABC transporter permease [Eubacteriales bacterium]
MMDKKSIRIKPSLPLYLVTAVALVLLYLLVMQLDNQVYYSKILVLMLINIVLAVSLNVTVGCLGQITLGHAGFMSVGAYTAALVSKSMVTGSNIGLPQYMLALLCGGIVAGVVGIIVGIPALRLKGDYLAIITLAFGEIIRVLIEYFDFTGGGVGLSKIPRLSKASQVTIIFWLAIVCVVVMYVIMTSRHGRAVLAIRDDEIAAEASGVNTTYYKTFAFTLSAIFAGIAGGIYAHSQGILQAKTFDFNYSINILVMVVLGGMGSFTGAILSAIVLTILPEVLRGFNEYRMISYAVVLILIMIFRPRGLLGRSEFSLRKLARIFKKKGVNGHE